LTGTASININGTVGATTPTTGAFTTLSTSGVATFSAGAVGTPSITTTGDTNTGIFFPAADTIAASTVGTERLRIDSSGNVGIGTSSPTAPLDVKVGTGNFSVGLQGVANTQLTSSGNMRFNTTAGTTIFAQNATESMRIDSSGKVGIGTSSPTQVLTVIGGGQAIYFGSSTRGIMSQDNGTRSTLLAVNPAVNAYHPLTIDATNIQFSNSATVAMTITSSNVGIGTASPNYKLEISTDSAGKPGVGGLWTVVSDERIKSNIVPANLDRCYEIVKSVPLKHFGFAEGVYSDDQIQDKHNLGWIAQDVQKVFKNAVSVKPFTLKTDISDGVEEYEEQDFTLEKVEKTETNIQVINGKAVQVSKVVVSENKVLLFDTVNVQDEAGAVVMSGDKPLTYQMPRMITKTRPKVRHDVIEDCLDLNGGQMIAALYGAVQALMAIVDTQAARITALEKGA
jgi:hypothetical protein